MNLRRDRREAETPAAESVHNLLTAGAVVAAGVLVCIYRAPKPVDTTDGLSWFGVTGATLLEYGITLLVTSALLLRAAAPLAAVPALRPARAGLVACAAFLPLMLATPYTLNTFMNWTHMMIGALLFVTQLLLSGWLWWARARTPVVLALFAVEILAGVTCFTSLIDLDTWMLEGQLVFQVAFTGCVALAVAGTSRTARSTAAHESATCGQP